MSPSLKKETPFLLNQLKVLVPGNHTIKRHAKSFYWAQFFLKRSTCTRVTSLYELCRLIDDTADDPILSDEKSLQLLCEFEHHISNCSQNNQSVVSENLTVNTDILLKLIEGMKKDRQHTQPKCFKELVNYCYMAAGTVGLMMADIMEVTNPRAKQYAMSLGIALQLTNIARDIWEDAQNGRVYIPQSIVGPLTPECIIKQKVDSKHISSSIKRLLEVADLFYDNGNYGLQYIPKESRLAIYMASALYRSIGRKIAANNYKYIQFRAYCTAKEKLFICSKCICHHLAHSGIIANDQEKTKNDHHQTINALMADIS